MYPRLLIDSQKLKTNIEIIQANCLSNGILQVTLVVKALSGNMKSIAIVDEMNPAYLGDSRLLNLKRMHSLKSKKMLLRIPNNVELKAVVKYSDCSLESEIKQIRQLNLIAKQMNIIHSILLMFDLGDLREGIFFKDSYLDQVSEIMQMSHIHLEGIGTNLTCFGGVLPSETNLSALVNIAHQIESRFQVKLNVISGGNSSTLALFDKFVIPAEINHLRIGEGYLLGRETAYGTHIEGTFDDAFILEAKVIECKLKPSYPIGEIGLNSFGEEPRIENLGMMKRAILGIGKQDVILDYLIPMNPKLHIIGGSSDHLIMNATSSKLKLNDIVRFKLTYPAIVHLMSSEYVQKVVK